jgi:AcrR family transcriptional regulator
LAAAAELIAERGIERTSLRSIGDRAGASRAMPGYHFGSKDGLIARLARRGHEKTLAAASAGLAAGGHDVEALSGLEALRGMIETFLRVFAGSEAPEERAVVVMWGATFPSEARPDAMVESDRETHALLADHIRTGQTEGSIRSGIDADAINANLDLLWVGCGTEDTLFNVNQAFSNQLTDAGIEHSFRVTLGGHTAEVWSRYLYEVAPQLL